MPDFVLPRQSVDVLAVSFPSRNRAREHMGIEGLAVPELSVEFGVPARQAIAGAAVFRAPQRISVH